MKTWKGVFAALVLLFILLAAFWNTGIAANLVDLTYQVKGILPHANGGTDVSSPGAAGNVLRSTGSLWASAQLDLADLSGTANMLKRGFGTTFGDSGGSALTAGSVVYYTISYACTISAWNITVAPSGTATFDIWKIGTGTAIPTVSNTITASALPAISTGTAIHSTTLSGWTTSVSANDIFGFQLKTVATAAYAEVDLECDMAP